MNATRSIIAALLLNGCAIHAAGEGGTRSTYILGFGVVRSPEPGQRDVYRSHLRAVGIAASAGATGRWVAGYLDATDLVIGAGAPDMLLEVGGCNACGPPVRRTIVHRKQEPTTGAP